MKKDQRFNHREVKSNNDRSARIGKIKTGLYLLIVSSILLPSLSIASEIYGRVSNNGTVLSGAKITVNCPDSNYEDTKITDNNGVYRFAGPSGEEKCSIFVNKSNSVTFFTSKRRTRVNLKISNNKLQRR
ncbi:MAG: carboxypeptidase regulatory-like domain-containing protein [Thiotrichaceae bacterium]|nr:carboxypeptidase regulatory-like domain-containing protein [Thiotrichaceae bacterium]